MGISSFEEHTIYLLINPNEADWTLFHNLCHTEKSGTAGNPNTSGSVSRR
jgi:hypothetical protein